MPTRNVVLTEQQNALIDRMVASGRFQNASEALRAGLRLLETEEDRVQLLRRQLHAARAEVEDIVDSNGPDTIRSAFAEAKETWQTRLKDAG